MACDDDNDEKDKTTKTMTTAAADKISDITDGHKALDDP